jgi:hypothetical protein
MEETTMPAEQLSETTRLEVLKLAVTHATTIAPLNDQKLPLIAKWYDFLIGKLHEGSVPKS